MLYPKPEKKQKDKTPYNSLQRKKERRELPEWKKDIFASHVSKPSKADRAEFPIAVVKAAIERSGGICEYCRKAPCTSTHHVMSRNRSGRGVFSNSFRACGACHLEIEGNEEKKQELISLYTQLYGERFWMDEEDLNAYNRKQAEIQETAQERKQRTEALEPIVTLLSTAAGRRLNSKEMRILDNLDERERVVFARLIHDVIQSQVKQEIELHSGQKENIIIRPPGLKPLSEFGRIGRGMKNMKYKVIKDIPGGWETSAKIGDVLTTGKWEGFPTLFKGKKAVCDSESFYANEHCKPLNQEGE